MSRKSYRLIEHTADIGIKVTGKDKRKLFTRAARAMFDIIANKVKDRDVSGKKEFLIRQTAVNVEELFVNWLNELLSLSAAHFIIFCDFKFRELTENRLEATAYGCDIRAYKMHTEIKAATYHQLRVSKTNAGWFAEVIFDV